jgi:predicted AlkP superfamily pyrophosphatase or phosphodiesterase
MNKKIIYNLIFLSVSLLNFAQPIVQNTKPKLIVGIVVDQMRNDYIYRYWNRYSANGFKRLVNNGFYFKNAHFNYIPTYTGPGHSSIYTGTTPKTHGIIANEWFDKQHLSEIYCVYDTLVRPIGTSHKNGQMSPKHQISSTIGDELKMSSMKKSKVFGIALKDRSAILPAGHAADGAFWFDESTGNFVSSSWYLNELPKWLIEFNQLNKPKSYLMKDWSTLYPIATYSNSLDDKNPYESIPNKQSEPIFPYSYKSFVEKNNFSIIRSTPYGNSLTKDLALECIRKESLGKDEFTDLIAISFSSPDIIAHAYGPRSIEIEDVYLRLDKDIEELLTFLDKEVGKDGYSIFLTADHGGADVPNHLIKNKIPAGYINDKKIAKSLKAFLQLNFNDSTLLLNVSNEQVFLNELKINQQKINKSDLEKNICAFLINTIGIAEAYPSEVLKFQTFKDGDYKCLLQNGFKHNMSGNIAYILNPAWMDYADKGTTHGAGYNYDTHVPIIFFGAGIKKGESYEYITITQIAPTIAELIQVNQPNGCTSQPLNDKLKK